MRGNQAGLRASYAKVLSSKSSSPHNFSPPRRPQPSYRDLASAASIGANKLKPLIKPAAAAAASATFWGAGLCCSWALADTGGLLEEEHFTLALSGLLPLLDDCNVSCG